MSEFPQTGQRLPEQGKNSKESTEFGLIPKAFFGFQSSVELVVESCLLHPTWSQILQRSFNQTVATGSWSRQRLGFFLDDQAT